jgi:hypothetical protein
MSTERPVNQGQAAGEESADKSSKKSDTTKGSDTPNCNGYDKSGVTPKEKEEEGITSADLKRIGDWNVTPRITAYLHTKEEVLLPKL